MVKSYGFVVIYEAKYHYELCLLTSAILPMGGEWIVTDGIAGQGKGVVKSISASTSLISSVNPLGKVLSDTLVAWNLASFLAL